MNKLELIESMIKRNKEFDKEANEIVLRFIFEFLLHASKTMEDVEIVRSLFRAGYCYYFAQILNDAFNDQGEICWCAPYGHICWVDNNGVPYDIEGICTSEAVYYIPIGYLENSIMDFKRIPGRGYNASKTEVINIIRNYEDDHNLKHVDLSF